MFDFFLLTKPNHGNDKDCAPFSRLCLELVTMHKYSDQIILDTKIYQFEKTQMIKSKIFYV